MLRKDDNTEIIVSVSCRTYNHEPYIRRTLEGFVKQKTNFRFEVIVHDDASTDNTQKIIKEFAGRYPDIIFPIYQTENQYSKGVKTFRTCMLPKMKGKYLAICEGDDYWSDEYKLQKQVDFLENHPDYSACVHNSLFINMYDNKIQLFNESLDEYDIRTEQVVLRGGAAYHTSALMYRMEIVKEVHSDKCPEFFSKAKRIGDYPLSIFLTTKGKVKYFPDIMSVYHYGTAESWTKKMEDVNYLIETHYSLVDMLESVDEYLNYELHEVIKKIIRKHHLKVLNLEKGLAVLKKEEMTAIFHELKLSRKIMTVIKLLITNRFRYYKK